MSFKKCIAGILTVFAFAAGGFAADHLAVAEPVAKGGIPKQEIEAVWNMLEAGVDGGYTLVTRSALKQIMTEIGLTDSSGLLNLNSTQKAKLGQIKTVRYLLIPTVSRFGTRINFSLMLLDASTGEIDPERKASETVKDLDELSDKLKDILREIGLGTEGKKRGKSALLAPVIRVPRAPGYLAEDFNVRMEEGLLENKIRLQNLQSVEKILRKNGIGNLYEAEPAMFVRIGGLLRVDSLIQATVSRFSCTVKKEYLKASKRTVVRCLGNLDGSIRIISAQTGEVAASIPFRQRVDFDDVSVKEDTDDWTAEDYGKYMIEKIMPQIVRKMLPKLR